MRSRERVDMDCDNQPSSRGGSAKALRTGVLLLVAVAIVLSGCSLPDLGAGGEQAADGRVLAERVLGADGGVVEAPGVSVQVPAGATDEEIMVRVWEGGEVDSGDIAGPAVEISHDGPLDEKVRVEWDISSLTDQQVKYLLLGHKSSFDDPWLFDETAPRIEGDTLILEESSWSIWNWFAQFSQEAQELVGRRVDPPECSEPVPDWVSNVVDADAGTSSAPLLSCVEDDTNDENVVTMRLVNNRTHTQMVRHDGEEPFAWVWEGENQVDVGHVTFTYLARQIAEEKQIAVPPLTEVAVGLRRPADPLAHFVGFEGSPTVETVFIDLVAYGAREVGFSILGSDGEFLDRLVSCGDFELAGLGDEDLTDKVSIVTGALKECATKLASQGSDLAVNQSSKKTRFLKFVKWLKVAEAQAYLADHALGQVVGTWTWGLMMRGQVGELGDWQATCADAEADRQAWSVNWTTQPVFNDGSGRAYEDYEQFPSIVEAAVAPLAGCPPAHIEEVRDLVAARSESSDGLGHDEVLLETLSRLLPPSEVTAQNNFPATFQMPSGNIHCEHEIETLLRCDILEYDWPDQSNPACETDYGNSVFVHLDGRVELGCVGDTTANPISVEFPYGETYETSWVTCSSEKTGLRCETPGGNWFSMARKGIAINGTIVTTATESTVTSEDGWICSNKTADGATLGELLEQEFADFDVYADAPHFWEAAEPIVADFARSCGNAYAEDVISTGDWVGETYRGLTSMIPR